MRLKLEYWPAKALRRFPAFALACLLALLADPNTAGKTARAADAAPLRILSMSDPFALVLRERVEDFGALAGAELDLDLTGYAELRQRILLNAFERESRFDLIALDVGWAEEAAAAGVVRPLDDLIAEAGLETGTFLRAARAGGVVAGETVGLPIQPHAELLFFDRDLLAGQGLAAPVTTEEVLTAARRLHSSRDGLAGICWNARRGAPLGQTMLHFLAAFGGRPLDDAGRPTLDSPELRAAIGYAAELAAVSPPDILDMALDQRIYGFASGRCALSYGWTGRSLLMQRSGLDLASGRIGVAPAPHAPGVPAVSPLGTWLLAIPANLPPEREARAFKALTALTSIEANRLYIRNGVGTLLHAPLMSEPALTDLNPAVALMGRLEQRGELQSWMRPEIPEFQDLTEILGEQVHAVLAGRQSVDDAARAAQAAFAALLEE